ncbi:hypothetical protein CLU79DRAFT_734463 [Phycomyces nitens]|nr:hypothetical protein CLU79DRAFT_734463 [Phycomyces nitens]
MLAAELPFEILTHIASFLKNHDILNCTQTCRQWTGAFETSLKGIISIRNKWKLDAICGILASNNNNIYTHSSSRIEEIQLSPWLDMTSDQLALLQQQFRNIKRFQAPHESLNTKTFELGSDWETWGSSLTHLVISLERRESGKQTRSFVDSLKYFKCLSHLEYTETCWTEMLSASLGEVESFHRNLPSSLTYLALDLRLCALSSEEASILRTFPSIPNILNVKLASQEMDLRWLCYFTRKYPNVDAMTWNSPSSMYFPDLFHDEALALFDQIPPAFRKLKTLNVESTPGSKSSQIIFWRLLQHFNVELHTLHYCLVNDFEFQEPPETSISEIICFQSNTLRKLTFATDILFGSPYSIPNTLGRLDCLVDLTIHCIGNPISIVMVLDNCTVLERLVFTAKLIHTPSTTTSAPHGLRLLKISCAVLEKELLGYLSDRCRQLRWICLDRTKILGPVLPEIGLQIKMPYSHLEFLQLNQVHFMEMSNKTGIPLGLITFHPSCRLLHPEQPMVSRLSFDGPGPLWIHARWNYPDYSAAKMHVLSENEASYVQGVVDTIQDKASKQYQLEFKEDLNHGFVEWKCGGINRCWVNGKALNDDVDVWRHYTAQKYIK